LFHAGEKYDLALIAEVPAGHLLINENRKPVELSGEQIGKFVVGFHVPESETTFWTGCSESETIVQPPQYWTCLFYWH